VVLPIHFIVSSSRTSGNGAFGGILAQEELLGLLRMNRNDGASDVQGDFSASAGLSGNVDVVEVEAEFADLGDALGQRLVTAVSAGPHNLSVDSQLNKDSLSIGIKGQVEADRSRGRSPLGTAIADIFIAVASLSWTSDVLASRESVVFAPLGHAAVGFAASFRRRS